jgi:pyrroline-5-carboxylate reductase
MARLLLVLLLLANLVHSRTSAATPLEQLTVGFLGVGKIGSAVARGYCCQQPPAGSVVSRPRRVVVSPRSVDRAQKLLADHPDLVEVAESNAAVVAAADVVFVGLLPATARAELPTLPFRPDQLVISMMAAVDLEEVLALVRLPRARVVRTVPLPSNARRSGPILVHPAGNDEAEALLRVVGCPVVCATEAEMKPLVSLTGHISSFFELQRQTQAWAVDRVRSSAALY